MVILYSTIVNVALPSIQTDLHLSEANLQWIVNSYTHVFGGFLLLGGRAGDLIGRKRLFLDGLVVFTVASLLNGLAVNEGMLIATRFFFQAEDGIRDGRVTGVQTCALPIFTRQARRGRPPGQQQSPQAGPGRHQGDHPRRLVGRPRLACLVIFLAATRENNDQYRSEERRVGKEGRTRRAPWQ